MDLLPHLTYAYRFRREIMEYLRVLLVVSVLKVTYMLPPSPHQGVGVRGELLGLPPRGPSYPHPYPLTTLGVPYARGTT